MTSEFHDRRGAAKVLTLSTRQQRTRQRLIDGARSVLAANVPTDISVLELTRLAGVGNGSFYNFFASKTELFDAALEDALEEHAKMVDLVTAGMSGAEAFATGLRLTTRLNWTNRQLAEVFVQSGFKLLESNRGITPRALNDLNKAIENGEISVMSAKLANGIVMGALFGMLRVNLMAPDDLNESICDDFAERLMTMIGMEPARARAIISRPLPYPPPTTR
jgi:AcrR family transcriptional regulator